MEFDTNLQEREVDISIICQSWMSLTMGTLDLHWYNFYSIDIST